MPDRTSQEIAALLAETLGDEKAIELVDRTARSLHLDGERLTQEDALHILEQLADEPGIVGITCRFAKSRLYLSDATKARAR